MAKKLLLISALIAPAFLPLGAEAQTTVVREPVPSQAQVIIANSPADHALQAEIRRIEAYNAQVNQRVGITNDPMTTLPAVENTTTVFATNQNNDVAQIPMGTASVSYRNAPIRVYQPQNQGYASTNYGQSGYQAPVTTTYSNSDTGYQTTRTYRVAQGDTLYALAQQNCIAVNEIKTANGLTGSNIHLGQVLSLPASQCTTKRVVVRGGSSVAFRRVLPVQTSSETGASARSYAVLPKDTLFSIGQRYCISAGELAVYNGLSSRTTIQPGQILEIPASGCVK